MTETILPIRTTAEQFICESILTLTIPISLNLQQGCAYHQYIRFFFPLQLHMLILSTAV